MWDKGGTFTSPITLTRPKTKWAVFLSMNWLKEVAHGLYGGIHVLRAPKRGRSVWELLPPHSKSETQASAHELGHTWRNAGWQAQLTTAHRFSLGFIAQWLRNPVTKNSVPKNRRRGRGRGECEDLVACFSGRSDLFKAQTNHICGCAARGFEEGII